jgi:hypothetical protein
MLDVIVLLLLVLLVVGALPIHAYSRDWGYYPSGIIAAILLVVALSLMRATPMRLGADASLPVGFLDAGSESHYWISLAAQASMTAWFEQAADADGMPHAARCAIGIAYRVPGIPGAL